jgi:hypothetical protein
MLFIAGLLSLWWTIWFIWVYPIFTNLVATLPYLVKLAQNNLKSPARSKCARLLGWPSLNGHRQKSQPKYGCSPVQPTKFYPNRDICKVRCLLAWFAHLGTAHFAPKRALSPAGLRSSIWASEMGRAALARNSPRPAPHARRGLWPETSLPPKSLSLASLSSTAASRGRLSRAPPPPVVTSRAPPPLVVVSRSAAAAMDSFDFGSRAPPSRMIRLQTTAAVLPG